MMNGMSLRGEIGKVCWSWGPLDFEIALLNSVLNPMILHGDGLGSFHFGCPVGQIAGSTIIISDKGGVLGVTKINESLSVYGSVLGVQVEGRIRGFHGGSNDSRND